VADLLVDARNALCPIPILRAAEALRDAEEGASVELVTTDVLASVDVPAWVGDMENLAPRPHTFAAFRTASDASGCVSVLDALKCAFVRSPCQRRH